MAINLGVGDSVFPTGGQDNSAGDYLVGDQSFVFESAPVSGDDVIDGGGGNDIIVGDALTTIGVSGVLGPVTQGNGTLYGGAGDDFIVGDVLEMSNALTSAGDDILIGGPGNDVMAGGNGDSWGGNIGSDTFVFNFTRDTDTVATTIVHEVVVNNWVETTITETFDAYLAAHNLSRTGLTQSQFAGNYGDWLNSLVARYHDQGLGQDLNGDGKISVGINQNSSSGLPTIEGLSQAQIDALFDDATSIAIKTGKTSQTRYFSNEFSVTSGEWVETTTTWTQTFYQEVVTGVNSGDGHDTIWDFDHGTDMLRFDGVREADFGSFFSVAAGIDADNDGAADDTMVSLNSGEWSVILRDVTNFDWHTDIHFEGGTATA